MRTRNQRFRRLEAETRAPDVASTPEASVLHTAGSFRASSALASTLFITATALVLLLSFALPRIVASIQDGATELQVERRALQEVSLATPELDSSSIELLQFMAAGYTTVELGTTTVEAIVEPGTDASSTAEGDVMTEAAQDPTTSTYSQTIHESAQYLLTLFEEQGLSVLQPEQFTLSRVNSYLATQEQTENARVFLYAVLLDEAQGITLELTLDEATGTAVAFSLYGNTLHTGTAETWTAILSQYYGLQAEILRESSADHFVERTFEGSEREYADSARRILSLADASGNSVLCRCIQSPQLFSFEVQPTDSLTQ